MYVFVWTYFITFTKIKIFGCALLNFFENDEWNDLYALVVFFESVEFIFHCECRKFAIEDINVSTK